MTHDDLRLLAEFEVAEEWLLEPGDILYVPPRVAHNGVAVGDDCMTYSIGFRAPSRSELIAHWSDHLLDGMDDDDRYADPDLAAQANPGEIGSDAIAQLQAMMLASLQDRDAFVRWFGQFNSTRKYPDIDWRPEEPVEVDQLRACLASGMPLQRNPASRFSFVRQNAGALLLFVDGECFECSGDTATLAEAICAESEITIAGHLQASDAAMALIAALYNQGSVAFEPADDGEYDEG